ncbi:MAG: hypothetical protein M3033_00665 [Acidobacteriota bacterium]|nr:hypothetical protein [Acidobacteriota bacterium]
MKKIIFVILISVGFLNFTDSVSAQTRKPKTTRIVKKPTAKTIVKKPIAPGEETAKEPAKKNERPTEKSAPADGFETAKKANQTTKSNSRPNQEKQPAPVYFYTFSQPQFLVSKILIEHDENGRGKISFQKRDFGDFITDPIQLSPAALERVKLAFNNLDFLDSKETYQSPDKNYAHLGTLKFAVKKDGRERNAEFNWTENKDAKILADEYRKIGQQFVWIFDINVARENQPLESPALMDALDSMIKRNEISDDVQMLPFLKELSEDERLPLIARNHAMRIVKEIEKKEEKK